MTRNQPHQANLHYRIVPIDPHAHLFEIELVCATPDPAGQQAALPAWIPGSYMIRDFARHVIAIEAPYMGTTGGEMLELAARMQARLLEGPYVSSDARSCG